METVLTTPALLFPMAYKNRLFSIAKLIWNIQVIGVLVQLLCAVCMIEIFTGNLELAEYIFGVNLILLILSLAVSLWGIQISARTRCIQLSDLGYFSRNEIM